MFKIRSSNGAAGGFEPGIGGNPLVIKGIAPGPVQLHQAGAGAAGQCRSHMQARICGSARPGNETITRLQLTTVGLQRTGNTAAQPLGCGLGGQEFKH